MIVGVVGLGLIGGSMARAYNGRVRNTVYGYDIDKAVMDIAKMSETIDDYLDDTNIRECELLIIALYPQDTVDFLREKAKYINPKTIVMDCCGTKRKVCKEGFEIASKYGFNFVGGHPMAGKQQSGFKYSRTTLFKGASMVIVPPNFEDIELLDRIKKCLSPLELDQVVITTAEKHDAMIAFTSQMAHVVSNAYIKSPTAKEHKGFSAGSYKDMTRVAYLNEDMWTELFMENKDNLLKELDTFAQELDKYRKALAENDDKVLKELLRQGKICKDEVDGR